MAVTLPYLVSPGSIKNALEKIRVAATPDRVTGDFVTTKLQIKGGTGAAILPYLKKIGFVASDGQPTDIYKRFRNPTSAGAAVADAIKVGYRELKDANEYFYELKDADLLALIVQVTGAEAGSQVSKLTLSTIKALKAFANFEPEDTTAVPSLPPPDMAREPQVVSVRSQSAGLGLNLAYTINLNLPATSDQAVFNAIFRSLKEHLLSNEE